MGEMDIASLIATMGAVSSAVSLIYYVLLIVCEWKMFEKAGEPGWAAIIPIYNIYKLFEISYGSGWKMLLLLVPILNIFIAIQQSFKLAKAFGQGFAFGIGLLLLAPIFMAIIAFSNKIEYVGPEF